MYYALHGDPSTSSLAIQNRQLFTEIGRLESQLAALTTELEQARQALRASGLPLCDAIRDRDQARAELEQVKAQRERAEKLYSDTQGTYSKTVVGELGLQVEALRAERDKYIAVWKQAEDSDQAQFTRRLSAEVRADNAEADLTALRASSAALVENIQMFADIYEQAFPSLTGKLRALLPVSEEETR